MSSNGVDLRFPLPRFICAWEGVRVGRDPEASAFTFRSLIFRAPLTTGDADGRFDVPSPLSLSFFCCGTAGAGAASSASSSSGAGDSSLRGVRGRERDSAAGSDSCSRRGELSGAGVSDECRAGDASFGGAGAGAGILGELSGKECCGGTLGECVWEFGRGWASRGTCQKRSESTMPDCEEVMPGWGAWVLRSR